MSTTDVTDPTRDRWFLGTLMRLHATRADTGGAFTVVEQSAPAGFSPPRHVHAQEDALLYVMEGRLTIELGGARRTIGPGESAFLPHGVPHSFRADEPTRLIEISTPGGIDGFYVDNGEPAKERVIPRPSAPDVAALARSAGSYGIEIVGPPMEGE